MTGIDAPAIEPQPLTAEAFAPFGSVVASAAPRRRTYFPQVFDHGDEARLPAFWVSRVATRSTLPFPVTLLERHPYSAQTFVPIAGGRYLVVATGADDLGRPDLATLRAFIAEPHQGVTYHRNVWHHGLSILEASAEFAVLMHQTGRGDDDVFLDLATPVVIAAPRIPPIGSAHA